jgi:hypothetical protein
MDHQSRSELPGTFAMSPFCCHRWSLARASGRAAVLAIALISLLAAGCVWKRAEVAPISDPLVAPSPQYPPDGSLISYPAGASPPSVELVWRHGMPSARVPNPHHADTMLICVYDEQKGRCESGTRQGVPQPIWLEAVADDPQINRTPIRQERPPFASSPDMDLGYEFRTRLRLRPEYRGRTLLWQVGACLKGTCRMSDPRSLRVGA